jgi:dTDP-4-dehydrorhamnose 3,5-epimerase
MLSFELTSFIGVIIIHEDEHLDPRGSFSKLFEDNLLGPYVDQLAARQVNLSKNTQTGTIRGFHYQIGQQSEYKIIKCLRGSMFDVLLDTRRDSKTYGECLNFKLTENDSNSLCVPPGVAHAFQTLEDQTYVHYVHTANYLPANSRGFNAMDPNLNVDWPLPASVLSPQDIALPLFRKESQ